MTITPVIEYIIYVYININMGQGGIFLHWGSSLSLKLLGPTITICGAGPCLKCTNTHVLCQEQHVTK